MRLHTRYQIKIQLCLVLERVENYDGIPKFSTTTPSLIILSKRSITIFTVINSTLYIVIFTSTIDMSENSGKRNPVLVTQKL